VTAGQGCLVVWYCSTLTGFWNDKWHDKQEVCWYIEQWLWAGCRVAECAAQCVWCWFVHVTRTHVGVEGVKCAAAGCRQFEGRLYHISCYSGWSTVAHGDPWHCTVKHCAVLGPGHQCLGMSTVSWDKRMAPCCTTYAFCGMMCCGNLQLEQLLLSGHAVFPLPANSVFVEPCGSGTFDAQPACMPPTIACV
jgi:hypothetical protein